MKYAEIGSISTGTLRNEDLAKTFSNQLGYYLRHNPQLNPQLHRNLRGLVYDANEPEKDWDLEDDLIMELMDALNLFAPPGAYFGAHPGDGSDFGFWPDEEGEGA
jgi:hypothetical protein